MNSKISYVFNKALILPIICCKCGNHSDIIFKEEESIDILNIFGLTE